MQVNFYLETRFQNSDRKGTKKLLTDRKGRLPIFLYAHFEGNQFKCATRQKCKPDHWDAEKQRVKKKSEDAEDVNSLLDSFQREVEKVYRDALYNRIPLNIKYLRNQLSFVRIKSKQEFSFFELFDKFIQEQTT